MMRWFPTSLAKVLGLTLSASLLASCGGADTTAPTESPTDSAAAPESATPPDNPDAEPTPETTAPATASPDEQAATASGPLREQNYCLGDETLFHVIETEGFWVNICGGDRPTHYVGVSKSDAKNIRLSLENYSNDGLWYEAYNGSTRYQVSLHGEESPIALVVTDTANNDRVLVQQNVQRDQRLAEIANSPMAGASPSHNYCQGNESVFVAAETQNYWLNICGGDLPSHYVGVSKRNDDRIRLPLADYNAQGTQFAATNGDIRYEIFLQGDPESLAVRNTSTGEMLVQEQLIAF